MARAAGVEAEEEEEAAEEGEEAAEEEAEAAVAVVAVAVAAGQAAGVGVAAAGATVPQRPLARRRRHLRPRWRRRRRWQLRLRRRPSLQLHRLQRRHRQGQQRGLRRRPSLQLQRSQRQKRLLGAAGQWPGGPAAALEVAVAGEEMAKVVPREVVVTVLARPHIRSRSHLIHAPRPNHRLLAAAVVWWASAVEVVVVVPHSRDASSCVPPLSIPVPVGWWPRPPASCGRGAPAPACRTRVPSHPVKGTGWRWRSSCPF